MIGSNETALITDADAHRYRSGYLERWLLRYYPSVGIDWHREGCVRLCVGGMSFGGPDMAPDGDDGFSFACVELGDRDEYGNVLNDVYPATGYLHSDGAIEGLY